MKGHLHERDIPQVRSRCPGERVYVCVCERVRKDATVIRWLSLYGGCRVTDFSNEFTLTATQVHIKARSSCITAGRWSKVFFLSSLL